MIDNFEDGDSLVIEQQGRSGAWYTYNDGKGTQTPKGDFEPENGGPSSSKYCAHTTGTGFPDWGAALAVDLIDTEPDQCGNTPSTPFYDASVFDGIAFDAIGNIPIVVSITTAATVPKDEGGTCTSKCNDAHMRTVTLKSETKWRQYQVRFKDLKQDGSGTAVDFDPAKIISIQFSTPENADFDLSIDNLTFFGKKGVTNSQKYPGNEGPSTKSIWAGARSSTYSFKDNGDPFPEAKQWTDVANKMSSYTPDSKPTILWIVCNAMDDYCEETKNNDKYLDYFDKNNINVILQVEPSGDNVNDLIDTILTKYENHQSVIGFGVDIEFWGSGETNKTKKVTDKIAKKWLSTVRSYNNDYLLMLKHFDPYLMPPCTKDGLLFINDTQNYKSEDAIMKEFSSWANMLAPADVGFQIGYDGDRNWWEDYDNPPKSLSEKFVSSYANTAAVFWVDFTLSDVFNDIL